MAGLCDEPVNWRDIETTWQRATELMVNEDYDLLDRAATEVALQSRQVQHRRISLRGMERGAEERLRE